MTAGGPLLTIAIPTFNRASYLAQTLAQVLKERATVAAGRIEILVSDNCSDDATPTVVARAAEGQSDFRSIRNPRNVGSDANIAQCFNEARGRYVVILGDDDMPCDGALAELVGWLDSDDYGVVYLRAYGYETDMRAEYPGPGGAVRVVTDPGSFIAGVGPYVTFISSLVIKKDMLAGIDANAFCGGNLVQVHLMIRAALAAGRNLHVSRYMIAATRNNSGGYDFAGVFVGELGKILDASRPLGLSRRAIRAFETRMILTYFPFYLLRMRRDDAPGRDDTLRAFVDRFRGRPLFWVWLAPTLRLPRPLALAWGGMTTLLGRIIAGDLRRAISFVRYRASRRRS